MSEKIEKAAIEKRIKELEANVAQANLTAENATRMRISMQGGIIELKKLLVKRVDIFGDGKSIYDVDKLPDEIVNEEGRWKKESGPGISYCLVESKKEGPRRIKVNAFPLS